MLVDPSHYLHVLMCSSSEDVSSMSGIAISYSREQSIFSPCTYIFTLAGETLQYCRTCHEVGHEEK